MSTRADIYGDPFTSAAWTIESAVKSVLSDFHGYARNDLATRAHMMLAEVERLANDRAEPWAIGLVFSAARARAIELHEEWEVLYGEDGACDQWRAEHDGAPIPV